MMFRGAGWNVIKVIWGREWDELLARDVDGVLVNKMNSTVDGEFQKYATESGAYIREHFFGPDPRLQKMVEHLTDEDLAALPRGGHDYRKLYAAYQAAIENEGSPTVILAKTVKGWTLGLELRGAQRDPPDQEADARRSSSGSATGSTSTSPTRSSRTTSRPTTTRASTRPSTST